MKILFVEPHPAPYRDFTLQELKRRTGVELYILSGSTEFNLHKEWRYISPLENDRHYYKKIFRIIIGDYRIGYIRHIRKIKPDIVVTSSSLEGAIAKYFFDCRVVLVSDTAKPGKNADKKLNRAVLNWMYHTGHAIWVPGIAAERYYRGYVRNDILITKGAYTYDAIEQHKKIQKAFVDKEILRNKWNIRSEDFVFLFIGRLIPSRHIIDLLDAVKKIREEQIKLIIIGSGSDEEYVDTYKKYDSRIIHIPSIPLEELETFYGIADAYVHPGEEPYSLALYEAAVAGIPIIASDKVGAVFDCVIEGENGCLFDFGDINGIAQCIREVYFGKIQKSDCLRMRNYIIKNKGIPWAASELMRACGL